MDGSWVGSQPKPLFYTSPASREFGYFQLQLSGNHVNIFEKSPGHTIMTVHNLLLQLTFNPK